MSQLWQSIKRTPYQSAASFSILFFTLFLSLFFFTLTSFFYSVLNYVETRPQVTAYFNTKTSPQDILKVKHDVESSGKTTQIKYVSQKDALKIYSDLNRDNPLLLEMVSSDILPASLEINAAKPAYLAEIASFLKKQPGIDEVSFQQNIVNKLLTLTTVLRTVSEAIFLFLILTAIVVLITTTAFKIALKRDEIELFQLLGATKGYVRGPFLKEGMFFGFLSGSIAFLTLYIIILSIHPFLRHYLAEIPYLSFYGLSSLGLFVWPPSIAFILLSYILTIIFGMTIGFFGSFLATSKYIK